jgi:hypothetical protein
VAYERLHNRNGAVAVRIRLDHGQNVARARDAPPDLLEVGGECRKIDGGDGRGNGCGRRSTENGVGREGFQISKISSSFFLRI